MKQLTKQEAAFAEEHLDLVHSFLRYRRLPEDDYFDVVVFGYLEAVQYHFRKGDGALCFDALAVHCMKRKFACQARSDHYDKRLTNELAISLNTPCGQENTGTLYDITPDRKYNTAKEIENRDLLARILEAATKKERETMVLFLNGYTAKQIASKMHLTEGTVKKRIEQFRSKAKSIRDDKPITAYDYQRRYWAEHREEISAKRKAKREAQKASIR